MQLKPLSLSLQVDPMRHGDEKHSSMFSSQLVPLKPGKQLHSYLKMGTEYDKIRQYIVGLR